MTYCTDISITHTSRVLQTGSHAATVEASLSDALEVATSLRGYAHHEQLTLTVHELCECCGGSGRVPKRRRGKPIPFGWLPCVDCDSVGFWPVASCRVTNPSLPVTSLAFCTFNQHEVHHADYAL